MLGDVSGFGGGCKVQGGEGFSKRFQSRGVPARVLSSQEEGLREGKETGSWSACSTPRLEAEAN